jgi:hypothetical protein
MKMREISRVQNKESAVNNYLLKHGAHIQISFDSPKDVYDDNNFIFGTRSDITLKKSKLSPKFKDIPCFISARNGGKIDEARSFMEYLVNIKFVKTGSWYSISDTIDKIVSCYPSIGSDPEIPNLKKNFRKDALYQYADDNPDFIKMMEVRFIDFINEIYPMQKDVDEEYKKQLMSECKYFRNEDPEKNSGSEESETNEESYKEEENNE